MVKSKGEKMLIHLITQWLMLGYWLVSGSLLLGYWLITG